MILFFKTPQQSVIATEVDHQLSNDEVNELCWLYGGATLEKAKTLKGWYVGPRREMITPWSTNAVEITQNMNLNGISRIEEYFPVKDKDAEHDPMLQRMYEGLNQEIFTVDIKPAPIEYISDLETYNEQEGLALSPAEIEYLHGVENNSDVSSLTRKCLALLKLTRNTAVIKFSVARSSSTARKCLRRSLP